MIDFDNVARQLQRRIAEQEDVLQRTQVMLIGLRAQLDLVVELRAEQQAMQAAMPTPAELDE